MRAQRHPFLQPAAVQSTFSLDPAHLCPLRKPQAGKAHVTATVLPNKGSSEAWSPKCGNAEAGGSGIQSHHQLHRPFKGGMSYMNPCLKIRGGEEVKKTKVSICVVGF